MMEWINKAKWIAGVLLVFALIVMTNLSDAGAFRKVKASLVTVYEDRVVAFDILFHLTRLVTEEQLTYCGEAGGEAPAASSNFPVLSQELLREFESTRLTRAEGGVFGQLEREIQQYNELEGPTPAARNAVLSEIESTLSALADIQLREGRSELFESERISKNYELFTRLEIVVLVLLALGIYAVILHQPSSE